MSIPPPGTAPQDGDVVLRLRDKISLTDLNDVSAVDDVSAVSFLVEYQGRVAGTVEVRQMQGGTGVLRWSVGSDLPGQPRQDVSLRAVELTIRHAFDELGLRRVTAFVDPHDEASLRIAGRAGLRREGLTRAAEEGAQDTTGGPGAERQDRVQLARLATDPEPSSRDGFIGVLNAGLPTKRVIAQGLIRSNANEILLCELTYKQEWDLPGGVVDPHESPAHAVVREIREEMQVDVLPRSLVAVNWLPAWRGWDDAMLCVFDLGIADDVISMARLEPRELRALHWCTLDEVERRAAPYVTRMLTRLGHPTAGTAYLEDGSDPSW